MQYKKEKVKNKLIEAGEEEFFLYGFTNSSIRRIVKTAGTTIGNFYNYFPNKEELFNVVVGSELKRFNNFLNEHEERDNSDELISVQDVSSWYKVIEENTDKFIPVFTKRFYILVACSQGTSFGNSRENVQEFIKLHFLGHVLKSNTNIECKNETADVLAYEFLEGILYILRNYNDIDKVKILIKNHMLFFLMGTMGILKGREEI